MSTEARRALVLREIRRHRQALAEEFEAAMEAFERGRIDYVPEPPRRGARLRTPVWIGVQSWTPIHTRRFRAKSRHSKARTDQVHYF